MSLTPTFTSPSKTQKRSRANKSLEIDEEWWWANVIRSKLVCVAKEELKEVDGHQCHQHQSRQRQIQYLMSSPLRISDPTYYYDDNDDDDDDDYDYYYYYYYYY